VADAAARRHAGSDGECTSLHEARLEAVVQHLRADGVISVLDLGCGSGALLRRLLAEPQFKRLLGVDSAPEVLRTAALEPALAAAIATGRLTLHHGCCTVAEPVMKGFDAAVLVETIEHIEPARLSLVERSLFARLRPALVVITTPNRDCNERLGVAPNALRHRDHCFEWGRARFEAWAGGVAARNGYRAQFEPIGPGDAWHGSPTQMAVMRRAAS
jgi:small RNA 2'-O-methyltransferase